MLLNTNMMKKLILICLFITSSMYATQKITPSEVYSEVMQIQKELTLIGTFLKKSVNVDVYKINTSLKPRHAWQKTYEILVKINILRDTHNMPLIQPSNMQPVLNIDPILTYEQTKRIQTELRIFKARMNINQKISKMKTYKGKTPLDVFNALNIVSKEMDLLNGSEFTPSYVFGETIRIYSDLSIIIEHLNVKDTTIPTKRKFRAKPKDTFEVSMDILGRIKYIQFLVGIESIDFYTFRKEKPTPSDVFGINEIILSELQTIKAYLKISQVTAPAKQYEDKTPSDVEQMLGWCLRRISLIESLDSIKGVK